MDILDGQDRLDAAPQGHPIWKERWFLPVLAVLVVLGVIGGYTSTHRSTPSPASGGHLTITGAGWVATIQADMRDQVTALNAVTSDAHGGDQDATMTDCTLDADKVPGWQADTALIPVHSIASPYSTALTFYRAAFTDCSTGDFTGATAELDQASFWVRQTTAAINSAVGAG